MTLVAMMGPCHSRIAGIARPVVFIVCVGPNTITDWRSSAAMSAPFAVPSVSRPHAGWRTISGRRSRRVAHCAPSDCLRETGLTTRTAATTTIAMRTARRTPVV